MLSNKLFESVVKGDTYCNSGKEAGKSKLMTMYGATRIFHLKIKTVIVYSLSCYSKPICIYLQYVCIFLWNKKKIVKEHTKVIFQTIRDKITL